VHCAHQGVASCLRLHQQEAILNTTIFLPVCVFVAASGRRRPRRPAAATLFKQLTTRTQPSGCRFTAYTPADTAPEDV
jgi:hypothetical protein